MAKDNNPLNTNFADYGFNLYTKPGQGMSVMNSYSPISPKEITCIYSDVMIIDVGRTCWNMDKLLAFHQIIK